MSLFWSLLLGATFPALVVWLFGRHLRRISGQPGLIDYVRMQRRRARRVETRDPVWRHLLEEEGQPLSGEERDRLAGRCDAGDRYRPRR